MDMPVEVISTVRRRRRWTVEQKVQILGEAFGSGGSVAAAADAHDLSRPLIYLWRRQAREGALPGVAVNDDAPAGFVPVRLDPPGSVPKVTSQSNPTPCSSTSSRGRRRSRRHRTIEITLANGRSIKVGEDIEPQLLSALVAALDASLSGAMS